MPPGPMIRPAACCAAATVRRRATCAHRQRGRRRSRLANDRSPASGIAAPTTSVVKHHHREQHGLHRIHAIGRCAAGGAAAHRRPVDHFRERLGTRVGDLLRSAGAVSSSSIPAPSHWEPWPGANAVLPAAVAAPNSRAASCASSPGQANQPITVPPAPPPDAQNRRRPANDHPIGNIEAKCRHVRRSQAACYNADSDLADTAGTTGPAQPAHSAAAPPAPLWVITCAWCH